MPLYEMFTDFTFVEDLSDRIDFDLLLDEVRLYKDERPYGVKVSNRGGWQSEAIDFMLVKEKYPTLTLLFTGIEQIIQDFIENPYKQVFLDNAWININGPEDYNVSHAHPRSQFSGSVYIKMPKDMNPNEGMIAFNRERAFSDYQMQTVFTKPSQYSVEIFKIKPKVGEMIFFPSYIQHEVEPHFVDDERISIAFNCFVQ